MNAPVQPPPNPKKLINGATGDWEVSSAWRSMPR